MISWSSGPSISPRSCSACRPSYRREDRHRRSIFTPGGWLLRCRRRNAPKLCDFRWGVFAWPCRCSGRTGCFRCVSPERIISRVFLRRGRAWRRGILATLAEHLTLRGVLMRCIEIISCARPGCWAWPEVCVTIFGIFTCSRHITFLLSMPSCEVSCKLTNL